MGKRIKLQIPDTRVVQHLEAGKDLDFVEERQLQNVVTKLFTPELGWSFVYHAFNPLYDEPGHPDFEAWNENGVIIQAELKSMDGKLKPAQKTFQRLALLHAELDPNFHYFVWRPNNWQEIKQATQLQPVNRFTEKEVNHVV